MSAVRQLQAYREIQLTTTDSTTVLLMLYQGAIDALNAAQTQMAAGNFGAKGKYILRANDIINQFIASLDHEVGGEIAANLEALYLYMLEQILVANVDNDAGRLTTVIAMLKTLQSGWEEAIASQRKQPAAGGAK